MSAAWNTPTRCSFCQKLLCPIAVRYLMLYSRILLVYIVRHLSAIVPQANVTFGTLPTNASSSSPRAPPLSINFSVVPRELALSHQNAELKIPTCSHPPGSKLNTSNLFTSANTHAMVRAGHLARGLQVFLSASGQLVIAKGRGERGATHSVLNLFHLDSFQLLGKKISDWQVTE